MQVTMTVNGREVSADIEPRLLLVHFIRDDLGLTGTHWGCDTSNCGVCTVWLDGVPVKSCTRWPPWPTAARCAPSRTSSRTATLDPVQEGFTEEHGLQCGFCTPGMLMTGRALLDRNPDPTPATIREAISGQHLPLHRLREHRPGHPVGRRASRRGRHEQTDRERGAQA